MENNIENNEKLLNDTVKELENKYTLKSKKHYPFFVILLVLGVIALIVGIVLIVISTTAAGKTIKNLPIICLLLIFVGLILFIPGFVLTIVFYSSKSKMKKRIRNNTLHSYCLDRARIIVYGIDEANKIKEEESNESEIEQTAAKEKASKVKGNKVKVEAMNSSNSDGSLFSSSIKNIIFNFFNIKGEFKVTYPSLLAVMFTRNKTIIEELNNKYTIINKSTLFGFLSRKPIVVEKNDKVIYEIYNQNIFARLFSRHDTLVKNGDKVLYTINHPSSISTIFVNNETKVTDETTKIVKSIFREKTLFYFFMKRTSVIK